MKLTYFQLEYHLRQQLASLYLLSGDELFLKQEALHLIHQAAKNRGYEERIRIAPDTGFNWEQLYTILFSNSLSSKKQVLELDFCHITLNHIAEKILLEYANHPVNDNVLLINVGKLDNKMIKSSWYQSIETKGVVVNIWPIPREKFPQWIINRAKTYQLTINQEAAHLLTDQVEGNLAAAAQALEKIYLLQPQKMIDVHFILNHFIDETRFSIFDFIENLVSGDLSRVLHILCNLREEGIEPVIILWAIARELRLLIELAKQLQQDNPDSVFKKHRIFPRRQNAIRQFLTKHSIETCYEYLTHTAEIDSIIKGARNLNIWEALQLFCLRLCA